MFKNELNKYEEVGLLKLLKFKNEFNTISESEMKSTIEFLFKMVIFTQFPSRFFYEDKVVEFKIDTINERCDTLKNISKKEIKVILEYELNSSRLLGYGYSFRIFCLNFYRLGKPLLKQTIKNYEDCLNVENDKNKQKSYQHIPNRIKWMSLYEYQKMNPSDILNEIIFLNNGKWIRINGETYNMETTKLK